MSWYGYNGDVTGSGVALRGVDGDVQRKCISDAIYEDGRRLGGTDMPNELVISAVRQRSVKRSIHGGRGAGSIGLEKRS